MMKRLTDWLRRFAFAINIAFAGCLLGAYLAPFTDPRSFILVSFLGLAYPVLAIINIVFAGFWLMRRNPRAWVSVIMIFVGIRHVTGLVGYHVMASAPEGAIRVVSFNARYFNSLMNHRDPAKRQQVMDSTLNMLKSLNPDVLCAQDVTGDVSETTEHIFNYIRDKAGLKYSYSASPSLATFSRFPIAAKEAFTFKDSYNSYHYVDLSMNGKTVRIFNLHLQSFKISQTGKILDGNQISKINEVETRAFYRTVIGKLFKGFRMRAAQAEIVARAIKNAPYPVVVCGDFNDTPCSFAYHTIADGLKDSFRAAGRGWGSTYAGPLPALRIDYIFTSPDIRIYRHRIIRKGYSDHYPIVSDIGV